MDQQHDDPQGVTRRTMIKTAGAAGAGVWAAPMITRAATAQADGTIELSTCEPGRCYCAQTTEGTLLCACFDRGACGGYQACAASTECPPNEVCVSGPDCCGGICVAVCQTSCEEPIDSCNGPDANCGPDHNGPVRVSPGHPPTA